MEVFKYIPINPGSTSSGFWDFECTLKRTKVHFIYLGSEENLFSLSRIKCCSSLRFILYFCVRSIVLYPSPLSLNQKNTDFSVTSRAAVLMETICIIRIWTAFVVLLPFVFVEECHCSRLKHIKGQTEGVRNWNGLIGQNAWTTDGTNEGENTSTSTGTTGDYNYDLAMYTPNTQDEFLSHPTSLKHYNENLYYGYVFNQDFAAKFCPEVNKDAYARVEDELRNLSVAARHDSLLSDDFDNWFSVARALWWSFFDENGTIVYVDRTSFQGWVFCGCVSLQDTYLNESGYFRMCSPIASIGLKEITRSPIAGLDYFKDTVAAVIENGVTSTASARLPGYNYNDAGDVSLSNECKSIRSSLFLWISIYFLNFFSLTVVSNIV